MNLAYIKNHVQSFIYFIFSSSSKLKFMTILISKHFFLLNKNYSPLHYFVLFIQVNVPTSILKIRVLVFRVLTFESSLFIIVNKQISPIFFGVPVPLSSPFVMTLLTQHQVQGLFSLFLLLLLRPNFHISPWTEKVFINHEVSRRIFFSYYSLRPLSRLETRCWLIILLVWFGNRCN